MVQNRSREGEWERNLHNIARTRGEVKRNIRHDFAFYIRELIMFFPAGPTVP